MLTHDARTYDGLAYAQTLVDKLEVREYLHALGSYVSVLELGMYDATGNIHAELQSRGLAAQSPEWIAAFDELVRKQAESPYVGPRLWAKIPRRRYACFYPMNKKRDGADNWFMLPFESARRSWPSTARSGEAITAPVTQVISGSIGFDDCAWGVDLYADDPLVFKKLVYDMRFDEASHASENSVGFGPACNSRPPSCGCFSTATPYRHSTPARKRDCLAPARRSGRHRPGTRYQSETRHRECGNSTGYERKFRAAAFAQPPREQRTKWPTREET